MEELDLASILAPESDYQPETPPDIANLASTSENHESTDQTRPGNDQNAAADYRELFDEIGGAPVVDALSTLLKNENADLTTILHPQQIDSVIWQALDNPANQAVLLEDPEVQRAISDAFFGGRDLQAVRELVDYWGDDIEIDPEYEQERQYQIAETQAHEAQINYDLEKRFFVDTEQDIAERFQLTDPGTAETRSDIRLAAQARFLAENADAYLQLQRMLAQGYSLQAQVAEARLNNKWQATLIKTAERLGKVRSQPQAPALPTLKKKDSGSYDLGSNDWLQNFMVDFKQERVARGL